MKKAAILGVTTLAAVSLAACSSSTKTSGATSSPEKSPTQSVKAIMNYYPSATQAGFYYAKQQGFYQKQGLNVTLVPSSGSQTTAELVGSGKYDIGYADGPTAMEVISKGAPDVIVSAVIQTTSQSIVSLKSAGITKVKDLVGKSIGVGAGTVGAAVLPVILRANGVSPASVKTTIVSSSTPPLPLLKGGKIDAFLGAGDLQDIELTQEGAHTNVIPFSKVGGGFLADAIIVNRSYLQSHATIVKRFVDASLQGWSAARSNPQAAAATVKAASSTAGSLSLLTQGLKVDLGLMCYQGATHLGTAPAADWNFTYKVLAGNHFISKSHPVSYYYSAAATPKNPPTC